MNLRNKKSKILTIALTLMLVISAALVAFPFVTAQEGVTHRTFAFLNALPNPVGVNQEVLLHIGITHALELQSQGWEGLSVTATDPNGDNSTLFDGVKTDSTGGTGRVFVPTIVGTWYLQSHFPEQKIPTSSTPGGGGANTLANTTMLASDSVVLELTVQSDPVQYYPGQPLPTEYWTRPIDSQLREWGNIGGSDMKPGRTAPRNAYLPYNDPPETAHVLWAKRYTVGGLVGQGLGDPTLYYGQNTNLAFELGDAYEGKWGGADVGAIIVGGRGYYPEWESTTMSNGNWWTCVDLRTGEELWRKTFTGNNSIGWGQLMYWNTYDFHGVYDYIIVPVSSGFFGPTNWEFYDAETGNWHYTLENVPVSGGMFAPPNFFYGPNGEFMYWDVDLNNGWMALWNSTNIPALYGSPDPAGGFAYGQWRPFGKTVDAQGNVSGPGINNPDGLNGYQLNVTIPDLPGSVRTVLDDRIIGSTVSTGTNITEMTNWAISLQPGHEGALLFNETWTAPSELRDVVIYYEGSTNYGENGVMYYGARELTKFYGFSTENGTLLWETTPEIEMDPSSYFNWYGWTALQEKPSYIAYGMMLHSGIAGIVYAYNITTGDVEWIYKAEDPYSEFLFNNNWWLWPLFVSDGKIYYGHLEHSPIDPRPRGAPFLALDVATGEEVFRVNGMFRQTLWGGQAAMGDSAILTQDTYDQRVYAVGKGASATTVTASPKVSIDGSSVLIEGTVTDISPGTNDIKLTTRFPNGVPAVADESMSDWMLYVYKQFPRPDDAVGVQVHLEAYDPNGNYQDLGTVTADSNGNYGFAYVPPVPGQYWISATFEGSEAYFGSQSTTYIQVDEAPSPGGQIEPEPSATPTPTPTEEPTPTPTPTPTPSPSPTAGAAFPTEIAIVAAVVVIAGVAVVAYWIIRRR
jgi:hypothetical protein